MNIKRLVSDKILLSVSIGLIYLWFGALKFFPGLSPAEDLAMNTIDELTFGIIPPKVSYLLLAIWETAVGLALLFGFRRRLFSALALVHLVCTFTPIFLFPEVSFTQAPYGWTLVGQYIFKNIVLIAALISIYSVSPKS
ncbi:MAG: DoxX family membrane protein [Bacteroidia bacterium]